MNAMPGQTKPIKINKVCNIPFRATDGIDIMHTVVIADMIMHLIPGVDNFGLRCQTLDMFSQFFIIPKNCLIQKNSYAIFNCRVF
jgi:hypothetical protein